MALRKVTDPALLEQLNAPTAPPDGARQPKLKRVTDPAVLAELNAAPSDAPSAAPSRRGDYRDQYEGQGLVEGNLNYTKDYFRGIAKAVTKERPLDLSTSTSSGPIVGAGEAALHLGSSALAPLFALPDWAITKMGFEDERNPAGTYAGARKKYVYQPRTSVGQAGADIAGAVLKPVGDVFSLIGSGYADIAGEAGASPELQENIREIAPDVVGAGLTAGALRPSARRAEVPTTQGASRARIEPTGSETPQVVRAKAYAKRSGLDWNALSDTVRARLTQIASDARTLGKLDPAALERQARLESLPVPIQATRGQLTRDPVAMTNEGNLSATETGAPIASIRHAQSRDLIANIDVLKERVRGRGEKRGAAETPEDVGLSVQGALRDKLSQSEKLVGDLYRRAEQSGELQGRVSPQPVLDVLATSPDLTHLGWVRSWLDKMEVVKRERTGGIEVESARDVSLKQLEDLRQAAVARAMDGGTEGYYAGKVIRAIDEATEGAGGDAYKVARAARRQQALDFEDPAGVARLVENRSRTDRATALEDTWRKTVLGGSLADLNQVKSRLLLDDKSGAGRRAWRDMRAETLEFIRQEATRGSQMLPDGTQPFSVPGMERALRAIGGQKLEALFGPGTAGKLQNILEAARITRTEPPRIHQGSSTVGNALAFLERSLIERVPYVGPAMQKARIEGAKRQAVREALRTPLDEAAAAAEAMGNLNTPRNKFAALAGLSSSAERARTSELTRAEERKRNRLEQLALRRRAPPVIRRAPVVSGFGSSDYTVPEP